MNNSKILSNPQDVIIQLGYFLVLIFALTRPLSVIDAKIPYFLEFYAATISYLLIILLFISVRKIRFERTGFLIIIFLAYCILSFAWGSESEDFIKLTLPFVLFFSAITFFKNEQQIKNFIILYKVGFLVPLIVSTVFIILGLRIQVVEIWSQVPRHSGVYGGSHSLAYQMLFFSYIFSFYLFLLKDHTSGLKSLAIIMFSLTLYCLFQSHTRTAFIGFFFFWAIFLWGINKRSFLLFGFIFIIIIIVFSSHIMTIFLKKEDSPDINRATSGRVEIWGDYYQSFYEFNVHEKLLGKGLGWKNPGPGFHNDFLKLLLNIGIFGLILYIFILVSVMYDIFLHQNNLLKYLFGSILISVTIVNFGSNVVISRVELSQVFWILIGFFYKLKNLEEQ